MTRPLATIGVVHRIFELRIFYLNKLKKRHVIIIQVSHLSSFCPWNCISEPNHRDDTERKIWLNLFLKFVLCCQSPPKWNATHPKPDCYFDPPLPRIIYVSWHFDSCICLWVNVLITLRLKEEVFSERRKHLRQFGGILQVLIEIFPNFPIFPLRLLGQAKLSWVLLY